jgi:hypothetical protein
LPLRAEASTQERRFDMYMSESFRKIGWRRPRFV